MEIRGERECKDCGTRWSYYETGSVSCPECGSLHSVGVDDDRKLHTAESVEFDLTEARERFHSEPEDEALDSVAEACREYQRKRGFVDAGALRELDDDYLVAGELRHVADLVDRSFDPTDDEVREVTRRVKDRGADDERVTMQDVEAFAQDVGVEREDPGEVRA
jgi:uncharacterized Zn finger protein (UPF0148 family)